MSESYTRKIYPKRQEGQGLVEYALILVLVSVVVIVILSQMGPAVGDIFSNITDVLRDGVVVSDNSESSDNNESCMPYNQNYYVLFPSGVDVIGSIGSTETIYEDSDCTTVFADVHAAFVRAGITFSRAEELCESTGFLQVTGGAAGMAYQCVS